MDNNAPYLTPPAEALQCSEKQVERVRELVQEEGLASEPLPSSRVTREAVMVERRRQELECL
jgi:predicted RNA-binding protein with PUA domain